MSAGLRVLAVALAAAGAGCAGLPPSAAPAPDAARAAQEARAAALGLQGHACGDPGWVMLGRAALSNGRDGGNARIEWTQGDGRLRLVLSAPIGGQGWVLEAGPDGARLRGIPEGEWQDRDPARLLRTVAGWDIPLAALGCWLRGVEADPAVWGEARMTFGADGWPAQLEQGGWRLRYGDWRRDPFSRQWLPFRIEADRGADRVRLAVQQWGLE
ncbi:outer membrane lipoprotein LolB [Thermomonas flagellata]|uniref:outer membrane lipoprotein LolB n=1 Tax=Thermomonas flagellata TaxID=2888524 RepID=UPI001F04AACA|nr:outer membrane lipoprotein LolB [Thermomonas flagellata]